ncbi:MAG: ATPase [Polyangiales bacterium]
MKKSSALRVAPGAEGVSIWSDEIFGDDATTRLRDFLARAFSVQEVASVELRRGEAFGRISYGTVNHPAGIWRRLSRALTGTSTAALNGESALARVLDAGAVFLDGTSEPTVHVTRIGDVLSTWRVRHHSANVLRLWHPVLRNRRDVVFRLEEQLAAILGVVDFRASALTGNVSIRFDARVLSAPQLVKALERAWPRLLDAASPIERPLSQKRLFTSAGLLGLAFTGQYLVPAARPLALAAVTIYSAPNVLQGARELKRGEVGLYTMYATGLGFMLIGGMPFASTVFALLMQLWPQLTRRQFVRSQRRVFGGQRRRPVWARLTQHRDVEVEVSVDDLRPDDIIVLRSGDVVPVDGIVADGAATVSHTAAYGGDPHEERSPGDVVLAGSVLRHGELSLRVTHTAAQSVASYVDSLLPHSHLPELQSSHEAERIAHRNAKPALALSALSLLLTRTLRTSQALIRPDYATAPRLSAQLSALYGVADGFQHGVLFKNPSALDRLAFTDVFVIDDTAGLDRRALEVSAVRTVPGAAAELVTSYALAAQRGIGERSRALSAFAAQRRINRPEVRDLSREAGVARFKDIVGSTIEVATSHYVTRAQLSVPAPLRDLLGPASNTYETGEHTPLQRPIWVLRDGAVLGVVSFARSGELVGRPLVAALKAQNPRARIVYLGRGHDAQVRALGAQLGIERAYGGFRPASKAAFIRDIGRNILWIGDGSEPGSRAAIAASTVSISVAPLTRSRDDAADVLLPGKGFALVPFAIELGRAHGERLAQDYRTVYTANLLGLAGAVLARVTSLQAGLLSNAGTGLVYSRHSRELDRLARSAQHRHAQLVAG